MGRILRIIFVFIVFLVTLRVKCVLCGSCSNQEYSKKSSGDRENLNSFLENVLNAQNELEWIKQLSKTNYEDRQEYAKPKKREKNMSTSFLTDDSAKGSCQKGVNYSARPVQSLYSPYKTPVVMNKVSQHKMSYLQNSIVPVQSTVELARTGLNNARNQRFNSNNQLIVPDEKSILQQPGFIKTDNSKIIRSRSALREMVGNHVHDPEVLQYLSANRDQIRVGGAMLNQLQNNNVDRYWSVRNGSPKSEKEQEIEDEINDESTYCQQLEKSTTNFKPKNVDQLVPSRDQDKLRTDFQPRYRNEDPTVTKYFEIHGRVRNVDQSKPGDVIWSRKVSRCNSELKVELPTRTQQKHEEERQRLQLEDADGLLKGVRVASPIGSTDNQMAMNKLKQQTQPTGKMFKFPYESKRDGNSIDRVQTPHNNINEELYNKDDFDQTLSLGKNIIFTEDEAHVKDNLQTNPSLEDHLKPPLKEDAKPTVEEDHDNRNKFYTEVKAYKFGALDSNSDYDSENSRTKINEDIREFDSGFLNNNRRSVPLALDDESNYGPHNHDSVSDTETKMSPSFQWTPEVRQERASLNIQSGNNGYDQQSRAKQNSVSNPHLLENQELSERLANENTRGVISLYAEDSDSKLLSASLSTDDLDTSRGKRTAVKRPGAIWQDDEDNSDGEEGMSREQSDVDSDEKTGDHTIKLDSEESCKEDPEKEDQLKEKQDRSEHETSEVNESNDSTVDQAPSAHADDAERLKASYVFSSTFDSPSNKDKTPVRDTTVTAASKVVPSLVRDKRCSIEVVSKGTLPIVHGNKNTRSDKETVLDQNPKEIICKLMQKNEVEPISQLPNINMRELNYLLNMTSNNILVKRSVRSSENLRVDKSGLASIDQISSKDSEESHKLTLVDSQSNLIGQPCADSESALTGKSEVKGLASKPSQMLLQKSYDNVDSFKNMKVERSNPGSAVESGNDVVTEHKINSENSQQVSRDKYVSNNDLKGENSHNYISQHAGKMTDYMEGKIKSGRSLLSMLKDWDTDFKENAFKINPMRFSSEMFKSEKLSGESEALKLKRSITKEMTNSVEVSDELDSKPYGIKQKLSDGMLSVVKQVKQPVPIISISLAKENLKGDQDKLFDLQSNVKEKAKTNDEIKDTLGPNSENQFEPQKESVLGACLGGIENHETNKLSDMAIVRENIGVEYNYNGNDGLRGTHSKGEKRKQDEDELDYKSTDQHLRRNNIINREDEPGGQVSIVEEERNDLADNLHRELKLGNGRIKRSSKKHKNEDEDELEYTSDQEDSPSEVNRRNIKQQIGGKVAGKSSYKRVSEKHDERADECSFSEKQYENAKESNSLSDEIRKDEMILAKALKESHEEIEDSNKVETLDESDVDLDDDIDSNVKSNSVPHTDAKSRDKNDAILKILDSKLKECNAKKRSDSTSVDLNKANESNLSNGEQSNDSSNRRVLRSIVRTRDEKALSGIVEKSIKENVKKLDHRTHIKKRKALQNGDSGVDRIQRSDDQDEHIKYLQTWAKQIGNSPPEAWKSRNPGVSGETQFNRDPHVRCTQSSNCAKSTTCTSASTCPTRTTTCKPVTCRPACQRPTTVCNAPCRRPTRPKPCGRITTCRSTCPPTPPKSTTCPTTTASTPRCMNLGKGCPQNIKQKCNNDEEYKGDLDDGQLGMNIVSTIFQHVDKTPSLKEHIGEGLSCRYQPIAIRESDDYRERSKEMLNQIMQIIDRSVEEEIKRRTCSHLPNDLKDFITWLMKTAANCNEAPTSAPFLFKKPCKKKPSNCPKEKAACPNKCPKPTKCPKQTKCPNPTKGTKATNCAKCPSPTPHLLCPPPADVQQKITLLQKLICEYNHLTSSEQVEVKPVHDYLVKQLKFLKTLVKQCKSSKADTSESSGCNTCNMNADDEKHLEDLIEKDLESLGLGPRAMLSSNIGNKFISTSTNGMNGGSNCGSGLAVATRSASYEKPLYNGHPEETNRHIRKHRSFDYEIPIEYEVKSSNSYQQSRDDDVQGSDVHKDEKKHSDVLLRSDDERSNVQSKLHKQHSFLSSEYKRLAKRVDQVRRKRYTNRTKRGLNKS